MDPIGGYRIPCLLHCSSPDLFDEGFAQQSPSRKSDPLLVHLRQELFAGRINKGDAAQIDENRLCRFPERNFLPTSLQFADASTCELPLNYEVSCP